VEKRRRVVQSTDENVIQGMRYARLVTKATDTPSEYVIIIAFPWQNSVLECASMLRLHIHCLSLPIFILLMEEYRVFCQVRIEYFYIMLVKFISKG
jgi:hypothetical protein